MPSPLVLRVTLHVYHWSEEAFAIIMCFRLQTISPLSTIDLFLLLTVDPDESSICNPQETSEDALNDIEQIKVTDLPSICATLWSVANFGPESENSNGTGRAPLESREAKYVIICK